MHSSQITAANRHIIAAGGRAVAYATGALIARIVREESPRTIYLRNASERRSRGIELAGLNFLESPMLVAGGTGAFHSQLMLLAEPEERAELELFMRGIARRAQHAAERHCRPVTWQGSQEDLREVVRLCRLHQQPEPGPVRTIDATTWSIETYLSTEAMVGTIAASGCRVVASPELIERVTDAVSRWLKSLEMDPESFDGKASVERVLREDLPLRVYQETKTLGESGRADYLTSHTLIAMLAERFPGLAKRIEDRLGGHTSAPTWWSERWTTIDVDPASGGPRMHTLCNELMLRAMKMQQDGESDLLRIFIEPGLSPSHEATAGIELLLRQGRKYLVGVVEMVTGMTMIPPSHLPHVACFYSDHPLAGEVDAQDAGTWYTTPEMERSYRLTSADIKPADQMYGHQLVESGHFKSEPSVHSSHT